jgi:triosephosphate isomerase
MARKPVMAANWKMNKTHTEGQLFVEGLRNRLDDSDYDSVDVVVCPPFTAIRTIQTTIDGDNLPIAVGAQNCHWETSGPYTGEVSVEMLGKLNVSYVIVGHSERREYFGETDEQVNKKVKAALTGHLTPIMCVGETQSEREQGATEEKVTRQVTEGLKGVKNEEVAEMVIAYEPIWAIGTGLTASPEDAQQTISLIRKVVSSMAGDPASKSIRIIYGGSVKPGNAASLMEQPDIDGALVGGASLDPEDFALIVRYNR